MTTGSVIMREPPGFTMISNYVLFEMNLPLIQFRLYALFCKLGDRGGEAFPSYNYIMAKLGIGSRQTVKDAIDGLVENGLLHVINRTARALGKDSDGLISNLYIVFNHPSSYAGYTKIGMQWPAINIPTSNLSDGEIITSDEGVIEVEDSGFTMIPDYVICGAEIPLEPLEFKVYALFAKLGGSSKKCFPGYEWLMKQCNIRSRDMINEALKGLVKQKLLLIKNRFREGTRSLTSNSYTIFRKPSEEAGHIRLVKPKNKANKQSEGDATSPVPSTPDGLPPVIHTLVHQADDPQYTTRTTLVHQADDPSTPDGLPQYTTRTTLVHQADSINTQPTKTQQLKPNDVDPEGGEILHEKNTPPPIRGPEGEATSKPEETASSGKSVLKEEPQIDASSPTPVTPVNPNVELPRQRVQTSNKKEAYGQFKRVKLTAGEYADLVAKYGQTVIDTYIKRVDTYSNAHNKKYHCYYSTIMLWIDQDKQQEELYRQRQAEFRKHKPNRFCNFQQREYDFDELEKLELEYRKVLLADDGKTSKKEEVVDENAFFNGTNLDKLDSCDIIDIDLYNAKLRRLEELAAKRVAV